MNTQPSTGSRSTTRLVAMVVGMITLASLVAGCVVVPVGPPRFYHPYYRYY